MAFTEAQKKVWRQLPEVKARQRIHNKNRDLKELTFIMMDLLLIYPWFIPWWHKQREEKEIQQEINRRGREEKARLKRDALEASKPIDIRGVLWKDMTREQRGIHNRWTRRNSTSKPWRKRHPEEYKASNKRSRERHLDRYRANDRERVKRLREEDVEYQLLHALRNRLRMVMNIKGKTEAARALVGCTLSELKTHLQVQFIGCMSWENYGKAWHIDHIVPCKYFDLTTERGKKECFHFSNLRPLWAKKNLGRYKKGVPVQQLIPFAYAA